MNTRNGRSGGILSPQGSPSAHRENCRLMALLHDFWVCARQFSRGLVRQPRQQKIRSRHNGESGFLVGVVGFEPTASWTRTKHSYQAELHPEIHVRPKNRSNNIPFGIWFVKRKNAYTSRSAVNAVVHMDGGSNSIQVRAKNDNRVSFIVQNCGYDYGFCKLITWDCRTKNEQRRCFGLPGVI